MFLFLVFFLSVSKSAVWTKLDQVWLTLFTNVIFQPLVERSRIKVVQCFNYSQPHGTFQLYQLGYHLNLSSSGGKEPSLIPLLPDEQKEVSEFVDEQLTKGYICPSKSEQTSPVFFMPKKGAVLSILKEDK